MKSITKSLLSIMNILAWLTCFGYIVKAGSILISYGVSIGNPEAAKKLYLEINLYALRQWDFWQYTGTVVLMVAFVLLESYIAFLVTRVLSKIKTTNPFTFQVAKNLETISYLLLLTWVVDMLSYGHMNWLAKKVASMPVEPIQGNFLFQAGIVFVFAQVFKKGVELQIENELTV
jgi:hypothetical protein